MRAIFKLLQRPTALGRGFFVCRAKQTFILQFLPIFGHVWCSEVTLVLLVVTIIIFTVFSNKSKKFQKS